MSDLGTEFTQLADCLEKSTGAKGVVMTVMNKAVLAPVALCVIIVIIASSSGLFSFSLLFVTNFSGKTISDNLLMVESALKIGGALTGLLLGPRIGLKMLLLLGNKGNQNIVDILMNVDQGLPLHLLFACLWQSSPTSPPLAAPGLV